MKFGIKRLSSLFYDIVENDKVNSSLNMTVLAVETVNKDIKIKRNFCMQSFSKYFFIFYQIFLSPQVKSCVVFPDKHNMYELHCKLPNDLRLRILEKYEISGKCLDFIE